MRFQWQASKHPSIVDEEVEGDLGSDGDVEISASIPTATFQGSPLFRTSVRVMPTTSEVSETPQFMSEPHASGTTVEQLDMKFATEDEPDELDWLEAGDGKETTLPLLPFAGSSSAYDETGEMDELDIPAFLRLPTET